MSASIPPRSRLTALEVQESRPMAGRLPRSAREGDPDNLFWRSVGREDAADTPTRGPWTAAEGAHLARLKRMGIYQWSAIAMLMGRTSAACQQCWRRIHSISLPEGNASGQQRLADSCSETEIANLSKAELRARLHAMCLQARSAESAPVMRQRLLTAEAATRDTERELDALEAKSRRQHRPLVVPLQKKKGPGLPRGGAG